MKEAKSSTKIYITMICQQTDNSRRTYKDKVAEEDVIRLLF